MCSVNRPWINKGRGNTARKERLRTLAPAERCSTINDGSTSATPRRSISHPHAGADPNGGGVKDSGSYLSALVALNESGWRPVLSPAPTTSVGLSASTRGVLSGSASAWQPGHALTGVFTLATRARQHGGAPPRPRSRLTGSLDTQKKKKNLKFCD